MKLSIERANELFNKLGVAAQVVEDDKADKDVDIEAAVTEYEDGKKAEFKPEIEAEVKASAETAATAKLQGSAASSLSRILNLSKKDLAGIEKYDDMFAKAKELYDAKSGNTKAEWEAERAELLKDHEAEIAEWEGKLNTKETEMAASNSTWQTKYHDHFINAQFMDAMGKAPRKGGDISELAEMARYRLSKDFDFKYNESTKAVEAFTKDGKAAKNFDFNAQILGFLEKQGNKATDTRDLPPAKVGDNPQYGTMIPPKPVQKVNKAFAAIAEGE